jgi:hypothetical protein
MLSDNYTVTATNTRYGARNFKTLGWEARGTLGEITYHVTFTNDNLPMFEELYGTKDGGIGFFLFCFVCLFDCFCLCVCVF